MYFSVHNRSDNTHLISQGYFLSNTQGYLWRENYRGVIVEKGEISDFFAGVLHICNKNDPIRGIRDSAFEAAEALKTTEKQNGDRAPFGASAAVGCKGVLTV